MTSNGVDEEGKVDEKVTDKETSRRGVPHARSAPCEEGLTKAFIWMVTGVSGRELCRFRFKYNKTDCYRHVMHTHLSYKFV